MSLSVCRVCLATNRRMKIIANTELQTIFENLTSNHLVIGDGRPESVCYLCHLLLQRCSNFVNLSHKAEKFLTQLISNRIQLTQKNMASICKSVQKDTLTVSDTTFVSIPKDFNNTDGYVVVKVEGPYAVVKSDNDTTEFADENESMETDMLDQELSSGDEDSDTSWTPTKPYKRGTKCIEVEVKDTLPNTETTENEINEMATISKKQSNTLIDDIKKDAYKITRSYKRGLLSAAQAVEEDGLVCGAHRVRANFVKMDTKSSRRFLSHRSHRSKISMIKPSPLVDLSSNPEENRDSLNYFNIKKNDVDSTNNKTFENATVQSHEVIHLPPTNSGRDLTMDSACNEVMILESHFCDVNEIESSNAAMSQQYNFVSDYSVRDKGYNPLEISSDDDLIDDQPQTKDKRKKPSRRTREAKSGSSASIAKSLTTLLDSVSHTENRMKIGRRSSFDLSTIKQSMHSPTLIRKRRHTIEVSNHSCQQAIENPQTTPCDHTPGTSPLPQKRRKSNTSALQRKMDAKNKRRLKYFVKDGCDHKCLKKCSSQMSQIEREAINNSYWELSFQEQHSFVSSSTSVAVPKRKITSEPKRQPKRIFFLKKLNGTLAEVCKIFFLTTLGFTKTNDSILYDIRVDRSVDRRGKHQKTPAFDRDMLTQHVESFHPLAPHKICEHATQRRYLPSDLNVAQMHKHFCEINSDIKISYELYRKHVKKMNITFTSLGNEECETCETYNLHKKETSHDQNEDCPICTALVKHHDKYLIAREL